MTETLNHPQIAECQTHKMPYMAAHADAHKRMKKGERQVYCTTCQRWKWQHELCSIAVTRPTVGIPGGTK
jgi:hypothetical protein